MADVRKSRGCYTGAVTKALEKVKLIKHDEVAAIAAINIRDVERIISSVARTETNFLATLEEAREYVPEGEGEDEFQDEEDVVLETFESSLATFRELADHIIVLKKTQMSLADLTDAIINLEESVTALPEGDYTSCFSELQSSHASIKREWNSASLPRTHPMKTEIDCCSKRVVALSAVVSGARSRAAPTTSPMPLAVPKTARDRTKLPSIAIPEFSGDILKWPTFWQQFSASIADQEDLPESTKLSYLRSAIKDPEAIILLNPTIDGPNAYKRLVKELHQRYARTKRIHRGLVEKLSTLPAAKYTNKELRRLLDSASSYIDCLKSTGQFNLESVITSLVYWKLPYKLQIEWDDAQDTDEVAPYDKLFKYVSRKILTLADNQTSSSSSHEQQEKRAPAKQERNGRRQDSTPKKKPVYSVTPAPQQQQQYKWECHFCKPEHHPLHLCPKWSSFTVPQRLTQVKDRNLCLNCLGVGHQAETCKSTYRCRDCRQAHHTSIHQANQQVTSTLSQSQQLPDALLQTAEVLLKGPGGREVRARALLDGAAGLSIITQRMAKILNLPLHSSKTELTTVQDADGGGAELLTEVTLSPLDGQQEIPCRLAVLKSIISTTPLKPFPPVQDFPHLWGLPLADPNYHVPGPVDILLGSNVWLKIQGNQKVITDDNSPVGAAHTIFGWVVTGTAVDPSMQRRVPVYNVQPAMSNDKVHQLAYDFWLSEEAEEPAPTQTEVEAQVEQHYAEHVTHNPPQDMYEVELPKISDSPPLGESKTQAVQRFYAQERTCKDKGHTRAFNDQICGYLEAGHAERVPEEELSYNGYYLPMHTVTKSSSTTTKLRIVFDASAASSTGVSLNQTLHIGPTLQPTLTKLLIKFRDYRIALTADITKMYRGIGLAVKDRNLHRFVWRPSQAEDLKDYRMTRVTFGVSCSPYLAIRTLQQTARDHGHDHPEAAHHIMDSFYVDDLLAGADTEEEAIHLVPNIRAVLQQGGFHLCKWRSSSQTVLTTIPPELQEAMPVKEETTLQPSAYPKALGLRWDSRLDEMSPSINIQPKYRTTKRGIISDVSKTYDVLGWISPAVLPMKVLFQKLWTTEQTWDGSAPLAVISEHRSWREELPCLQEKTIPRGYSLSDATIIKKELHGFCDASNTAFGAVVYVRTVYAHQSPTVTLVTAKTKVTKKNSPTATIPRLELCGAVLLTKLLNSVSDVLNISLSNMTAWTDSSIVFAWLDGHPRKLPQYVHNRVYYVLENTNPQTWKHVPGINNPADCASRGMSPRSLLLHSLWWEGPDWLYQEPVLIPEQPPRKEPPPTEGRLVLLTSARPDFSLRFEERSTSYYTIIIHVAWWFRLYERLKQGRPVPDDRGSHLTPRELERAEIWLMRKMQQRCFAKEVKSLQAQQNIAPTSRLQPLTPSLDTEGLLRVGGRLKNSSLSKYQAHPIIVDGKSTLIQKLFVHKHISTGHGGPSQLLYHTSRRFYVIGARRLARSVCRECVTCRRVTPQPMLQQMGDLPSVRTSSDQPVFSDTGMDFAGPFDIKQGYTRKPVIIKAHICIFVCMVTKAVHLEVTSDLTTEAFVACLRRFVARRNCPKTIRCDNGPNYVGARNELKRLYQFLSKKTTNNEIHQYLLSQRIQWLNTPAAAPHFGGLWEAAVRSMKRHLRRMTGSLIFTFEELTTVSCQIEAFLNSRPLLPLVSHNPDGLAILTAGHFLFMESPRAYPEDPAMPEEARLLQRWEKCQSVVRHLWARWNREYLHLLQARTKWQHTRPNVQLDDLVIFNPGGEFPCRWPIAKIVAVHPGTDGLVRVVTIQEPQNKHGVYPDPKKRPVTKLSLVYRPEINQTETTSSASPGSMFGQNIVSNQVFGQEPLNPTSSEEGCQTRLPTIDAGH